MAFRSVSFEKILTNIFYFLFFFHAYICSGGCSCRNRCTNFWKMCYSFKLKKSNGWENGFPRYLYMESIDQNCKFSQFIIIINCQKLRSRLFQELLNLCTYRVRQLVVPFRLFIIKLLAKIFSRVMQQLLNEPSRLFQ